LDAISFDQKIADVDLIITGEGRFDAQSLSGKAPMGILARADAQQIETIIVVGQGDVVQAEEVGFSALFSLTSFESDIATCISNPAPLLRLIGQELARTHL
jgi:glycerate kinase